MESQTLKRSILLKVLIVEDNVTFRDATKQTFERVAKERMMNVTVQAPNNFKELEAEIKNGLDDTVIICDYNLTNWIKEDRFLVKENEHFANGWLLLNEFIEITVCPLYPFILYTSDVQIDEEELNPNIRLITNKQDVDIILREFDLIMENLYPQEFPTTPERHYLKNKNLDTNPIKTKAFISHFIETMPEQVSSELFLTLFTNYLKIADPTNGIDEFELNCGMYSLNNRFEEDSELQVEIGVNFDPHDDFLFRYIKIDSTEICRLSSFSTYRNLLDDYELFLRNFPNKKVVITAFFAVNILMRDGDLTTFKEIVTLDNGDHQDLMLTLHRMLYKQIKDTYLSAEGRLDENMFRSKWKEVQNWSNLEVFEYFEGRVLSIDKNKKSVLIEFWPIAGQGQFETDEMEVSFSKFGRFQEPQRDLQFELIIYDHFDFEGSRLLPSAEIKLISTRDEST